MKVAQRFPVAEIVVIAIVLAALTLLTYAATRRSESAGQGIDTRSTYDSASGGYRAWYELLAKEGIRAERFERRPAFLDQSVDVYVFASNLLEQFARAAANKSVELTTPADWDAIAKWVRSGGHLVWLADGHTRPQYLNIPGLTNDGPSVDAAVPVALTALTHGVGSVSGTSKIRVPFGRSAAAAPVVADDTGGVVDSLPLGKGTVTIVSDETLFENARLEKADNATLAYNLATTGLTGHGTVAFDEWSHGFEAGDSWWQVLPRSFQVSLIAIGIAFALMLVGTAFRFGPTARLPDASERTSAEYLSSMALLYERGHALRAAIRDVAGACIREVAASLGMSETTPARTIASRLESSATGAEYAEAIMELDRLRSFEVPRASELLRAAQLCTALRKEFSRHGRIGIGRRASTARRTA